MQLVGYAIAIMAIVGTMGLTKAQVPDTLSKMEILEPSVTPWYLPEGQHLKLVCATPVRTDINNIAWEKNGQIIDQNAMNGYFVENKVVRGEFISTLEKDVTTKEDADSYLCHPTGQPSQGYNVVVNIFTFEAVDAVLEKYGENATLQCIVDLDSHEPVQWFYDGEKVVADDEKYIMDTVNGSLTITKVIPEDVGEYKCKVDLANGASFNKTVNLFYDGMESQPYVYGFDKSKNLVQGDPLVLECEAVGHPEPVLAWYKDDKPLDTSDSRVKLSPNKAEIANGTLRLEDLQFEDRAEYTCVATNEYGSHNSTILVRVKDKLAALWPFLGICAEVAILVIIIFVYENRRSKKLEEMDAREEADHLTNSHTHKGGDEVRQRK